MKPLLLLLSAAILLGVPTASKADDSAPRGYWATSGLDPDLAAQFYETISSTSSMAVDPSDPLSISGTFPQRRALTVTGSASLQGNIASNVSGVSGSGSNGVTSGAYSTFEGTTNNAAIQIYPRNLPSGAYQVYVVTRDGNWHAVGSFVMPAIITTYTDAPNNTVVVNNQLILLPVPVAPLPDNDFSTSSNSLNYDWLESGIVRFATPNMPAVTYKLPKGSKTLSGSNGKFANVPQGEFDEKINPFDISAIVVQNAYTGKNILSSPLKGNGSFDTTNTNLLSLVQPAITGTSGDAWLAGGIANLKTSFSRSRTKSSKGGSLNFSVTGLPANTTYGIQINGNDLKDLSGNFYKVTTNSKGSLVITSSSVSGKKTTSGLTVIAAADLPTTQTADLSQVTTITVNEATVDDNGNVTDVGEPILWTSF